MESTSLQPNKEQLLIKRAIYLLDRLYEGINPLTGERLPDTSPFQNSDIVRSLRLGIDSLKATLKRKERTTFARTGQPWDSSEDARVCQEFDAALPFEKIAEGHMRSRGAILARLEKLGRVQRA